jgi:hypothetical protein
MASSGKKPSKSSQPASSTQSANQPQSIQEEAHNPGVDQHGNEPLSRGERRRQQFEQKRVERKQAPAKQQRRQKIIRIAGIALAALVLVGVGYEIFNWLSTRDDNREPAGVVTYNYTGGDHSNDPVDYTESPPVGGTHNPVWQTCAYYDGVVASEHAVHSMEHGAVWITYRPDVSDSDKQKLQNWAKDRTYLLVSEYDDQSSPFVFTAWNNQLPIDSLSDQEATQFMNYFIQGPQTPERGASCSGGNTTTVG